MNCIQCNSSDLKKLGMRLNGNVQGLGYECRDCGEKFTVPKPEEDEEDDYQNDDMRYVRDDAYITNLSKQKRFIFVSALNNTPINEDFIDALAHYSMVNGSAFVAFPLKYRNPSMIHNGNDDTCWDESITPYLVENNFDIGANTRVLGGLKIQATAENPLSGVDGMSKGHNIILGHPQVALKTLPRQMSEKYPAIATTTGAVTTKQYSTTKAGFKAAFNHSMSALAVEIDDDGDIHFRHLNFDGKGFYDLDMYYSAEGAILHQERVKAIVTGDEHAMFADEQVVAATYLNKDSMVKALNPDYIVRHDVLDFFSASHHGRNNVFLKFAKYHSEEKVGSVERELMLTINHINDTTPEDTVNIMVASNHNEHLLRWLNECDPKHDPENALLYHSLMYRMLDQTYMGDTGAHHPEPFELFSSGWLPNTRFLSRNETFKIGDVEISNHGDFGTNGSRGTPKQFANIPVKTITGHRHSPCIEKGNFTTGTLSRFDLSYMAGLSSWHHAHVVIYPNGRRQLVFIVNGKYRV